MVMKGYSTFHKLEDCIITIRFSLVSYLGHKRKFTPGQINTYVSLVSTLGEYLRLRIDI